MLFDQRCLIVMRFDKEEMRGKSFELVSAFPRSGHPYDDFAKIALASFARMGARLRGQDFTEALKIEV